MSPKMQPWGCSRVSVVGSGADPRPRAHDAALLLTPHLLLPLPPPHPHHHHPRYRHPPHPQTPYLSHARYDTPTQ
eukprot:2215821-Pyramimonas_sp.AAC.1